MLQSNYDWTYAVVVDAGSSGTRWYLYRWRDLKSEYILELADKKLKRKGDDIALSEYITNWNLTFSDMQADLVPFLLSACDRMNQDIAENNIVPTPPNPFIFVGATAGLRLLSSFDAQSIITQVRYIICENDDLEGKFTIKESFKRNQNIRILSGEEESIFGWLSSLAIRAELDDEDFTERLSKRLGALDMGGASTQITLNRDVTEDEDLLAGKVTTKFYGEIYDAFADSCLKYGGDQALILAKEYIFAKIGPIAGQPDFYEMPCFFKGIVDNGTDLFHRPVYFVGTSNITGCKSIMHKIFNLNQWCAFPRCSIDGQYIPRMDPSGERNGGLFQDSTIHYSTLFWKRDWNPPRLLTVLLLMLIQFVP